MTSVTVSTINMYQFFSINIFSEFFLIKERVKKGDRKVSFHSRFFRSDESDNFSLSQAAIELYTFLLTFNLLTVLRMLKKS